MTQLHQRKRSEISLSSEHYTPKDLYIKLCAEEKITPRLDVAATDNYHLCQYYFTKEDDALKQEWLIKSGTKKTGIWCNPPNPLTQKFIEKADEQWFKYNLNILMLIPINATVTRNGQKYIWNNPFVKIRPVLPTPRFIFNGVQQQSARNRYCLVRWNKRNNI